MHEKPSFNSGCYQAISSFQSYNLSSLVPTSCLRKAQREVIIDCTLALWAQLTVWISSLVYNFSLDLYFRRIEVQFSWVEMMWNRVANVKKLIALSTFLCLRWRSPVFLDKRFIHWSVYSIFLCVSYSSNCFNLSVTTELSVGNFTFSQTTIKNWCLTSHCWNFITC